LTSLVKAAHLIPGWQGPIVVFVSIPARGGNN
jgi:hypothetical protein